MHKEASSKLWFYNTMVYNISDHELFMTHRVLKSHRSKICLIYMQSWEQCAPFQWSPQWLCDNSCTWAHDVHHVPKCMSYHKAIVVITRRAHYFHDCIWMYKFIENYREMKIARNNIYMSIFIVRVIIDSWSMCLLVRLTKLMLFNLRKGEITGWEAWRP